jgi:uncharacterized protein (DUF1810 family)
MSRLARFLQAQTGSFEVAKSELSAGAKRSHWIWYIFPQRKGLGSSHNAQHYGIEDDGELEEYIRHPILGERYFNLVNIVHDKLVSNNVDPQILMGSPIDVTKLRSSLGTFSKKVETMEPKSDSMNDFLKQADEIAAHCKWRYVS